MHEDTKKRILSWLAVTLGLALVLSLGWGYYEFRTINEYKTEAQNQYSRAFTDLTTSLNELETSMSKAKVAGSTAQKVLYLGESWKGSETAVSRLGQLPADEVGISYIGTFINQISDFSKEMTRRAAGAGEMSAEEQKTFNDMHERVIEINRAVQQIYNQFNAENLAWVDKQPGILQRMGIGKTTQTSAQGDEGEQSQKSEQADSSQQSATSVRGGLKQLEVALQKYPPFTYQGELDKHFVEKPLGLPDKVVNESQAITSARDFLRDIGFSNPAPKVTNLSENPLGGYDLTDGSAYLEVSKKGGVVTFFRDQREINDRRLDVGKAIDHAYNTLDKMGWNLTVISTQDFGSYIQVDVVPKDEGVLLYPDKIRLTVATDNGQIVGFDANPYYAYHHQRDLVAKLTLAQAKAKLRTEFKVIESRKTVIAKLGTREEFCYEFRGTAFGEEYMVYINAVTGTEEKISRIIDMPTGKLIQ
ncbi:germination protein YpeB [Dehalobacter sp. DCM]|uniref:PepSY1/2 domain-containing protein n=1 Tax=Dehalobacter sp. DCM TaxID=2907827 RepID=UPI00308156E4|nr:germination protein YpeB [Dehalobacter sp. DCM]